MPSDEGPQFYSVRESVPIKEIPPFQSYIILHHSIRKQLLIHPLSFHISCSGIRFTDPSGYKPTNDGTNIAERRIVEYQGLNIKFPIGYNLITLVVPVSSKVLYGRMKPDAIQFPESNPSALYPPYEIPTPLCHALFSNNNIAVQ